MQDDARLLERLRERDPRAFSFLLETYSDKLFRLAVGILHDDEEAEGVVQDAFLRFIEKIDTFRGEAKIGTWLYRVTYNRAVNIKTRRADHTPVVDDDTLPQPTLFVDWTQLPEETLLADEALAMLRDAINTLPENLRVVFVLRQQEGLSTAETADILAITKSTVKVRLHRARLALREYLSTYYADLIEEV